MLATKANVYFEGPTGELKNRYTGTFLYRKSGAEMKCQVEFMMMADMPIDEMHVYIVQQINDKMCREYPYNELMEIEAMEPRAIMYQNADSLAKMVTNVATELKNFGDLPEELKGGAVTSGNVHTIIHALKDSPLYKSMEEDHKRSEETWPEVVERFYQTFVENNPWEGENGETKNVAIGNIPAFFEPVVRMFLGRGYREGYKDAMDGARKAFTDRVLQRLNETEGIDLDIYQRAVRVELKSMLEWLKR